MIKKVYLHFAAFLICCCTLTAQNFAPTRYIGIENGLSNNSVRSVFQDHNGFMWFATYDGLNRFDGYTFKVFRNKFNNPHSLVNNVVSAITEDRNGNVWAGTRQGLSIYDIAQDTFQQLAVQSPSGKTILLNDLVKDIKADEYNNLFVASENSGLFICAEGRKVGKHISIAGHPADFTYGVQAVITGKGKETYAFVQGLGLYKYNYQHQQLEPVNENISHATCMIDAGKEIWLGSGTTVFRVNKATRAFKKLAAIDTAQKVAGNQIFSLCLAGNGPLWVGTSAAGVEIWDIATGKKNYLKPGDSRQALSGSMVYNIYQDKQGRTWICTARGGVDVMDPGRQKVTTIAHDPANSTSIPGNFVSAVFQFSDSLLWIATEGSGLTAWNYKTNSRSAALQNVAGARALSTAYIVDIKKDHNGDVWLATFNDGVYRYHQPTNSFEHYNLLNTANGNENKVSFYIYEDHQKNLWASTLRTGDIKGALFLLNRNANKFEVFDPRLSDIFCLVEDATNQLWAGNLTHLVKIDKANKQHQYFSLGNSVRGFYADVAKRLWIGTEGGGLILFDPRTSRIIQRFTTEDGLCNNSITAIIEGEKGNLWLSTYNGISNFNINQKKFTNFYKSDGLQSNQFNLNAAYRLSTGELAFGGIKGLNLFYPDGILPDSAFSKLFFNTISVNGTELNSRNAFVVKTAGSAISQLKVPYDDAVFKFDFSSPNFSTPDKIQYAYLMEGWDKDWNYISRSRSATYTHLREGNYTFRVKATSPSGVWQPQELTIAIQILPPWYRSWWAWLLYFSVVFLIIRLLYRYKTRQTKLSYQVNLAKLNADKERILHEKTEVEYEKVKADSEMERLEREMEQVEFARERAENEAKLLLNEKEREINEKRLTFFTNISHEFRTPLTLIINPLKDLIEESAENGEKEQELNLVYRNARRLLSLVDQMLLFRRNESGIDTLKVVKLNFFDLCKEVYLCFAQLTKVKGIQYDLVCKNEALMVWADREKAEIILYNLLSNALKYTPQNGKITLLIEETDDTVVVSVADNGPGIPPENKSRLFEKFSQGESKNAALKPGFGIGLYLVKQFAVMHQGSVSYSSVLGAGATFIVVLKKGNIHFTPDDFALDDNGETFLLKEITPFYTEENPVSKPGQTASGKFVNQEIITEKKVILLVDDNAEMLQYITGIFQETFVVYQAATGADGLKIAEEKQPDIIISDIKMQGMSGIELCKAIKETPATSHMPVILLTGTSAPELKLESIENGADDYITKPFEKDLLVARVRNLLKAVSNLQQYFLNEITLDKNNIKVPMQYKEFLDHCIAIVEKHLQDEQFSMKTLQTEIGMSRSKLYRLVKSISGLSPVEFIRFIRLRKAAELFVNTNYNVNETANEVGMFDVRYFREQFNKVFGINPSDYIRKYRGTFGSKANLTKR